MTEYQVIFQPSGRRGSFPEGVTLLKVAQDLGVSIEAACGGAGVCGKCRVIVESGNMEKLGIRSGADHVSSPTETEKGLFTAEELASGFRLACHTQLQGDVVVTVPEVSRGAQQVILDKGKERQADFDPNIKVYTLQLTEASLDDNRDDSCRLLDALEEATGQRYTLEYGVLKQLPQQLRQEGGLVTATINRSSGEVIRVRSGVLQRSLGIAIDIGTTTLAAYLCDLLTGKELEKASRMNSEIGYGEDVLARISYAMSNDDGLERLSAAIRRDINELAQELTERAGYTSSDVDELVLVYNTAMQHFTLGLDPRHLGRTPFVAVVKEALDIKARDLGLKINPSGNVYSLPIEAGFVGADNVAVLLAEAPYKGDAVKLLIDIGTNGEIDLGNKERLLCTSCATGPALEGAQIKFGMRAAPGAIERVTIDKDSLDPSYKVIGSDRWYPEEGVPPVQGICGSGIIDVIAALFTAGIIGKTGRFNLKLASQSPRIRRDAEGKAEYVIAWGSETAGGQDIVINQSDVRAVQLAKGAIYVGAKYLMEKFGVEKVDEIVLAGAFGSYIDTRSAMTIGLLPDCDLEHVYAVGNAAGDGAKIALLSLVRRKEAAAIARQVEFVETVAEKDFQAKFMDAIAIPHAKDAFPHIGK